MYALYYLGPPLEEYLGRWRYGLLYLMAALGGAVASYYFSPDNVLSVGASGAIFGLMTSMLVLGRQIGVDTNQVAVLLVINILIGFSVPAIDWRAHFGGAVIGGAVAWAVGRRSPQWLVVGGIVVGLVAAVVMRTGQIMVLA